MSVLQGLWAGTIEGTSVGTIQLDLRETQGVLEGTLQVYDQTLGALIQYDCAGRVEDNRVELSFTPRVFPDGAEVKPGRMTGTLQADGTLSGAWQTENGGSGTFVAIKSQVILPLPVAPGVTPGPTMVINYERQNRILSCAVDIDILRRVYWDLSAGSDAATRLELARQVQTPGSPATTTSPAPVDPAQVRSLYSVTILTRGTNGEQIISLDPALLEEGKLPKPIQSIEFRIGGLYQIARQAPAPNCATIMLDFIRPPLFDLSNVSNAPTPNNSLIQVSGNESMWVSGVYEKVTTTLRQGRVKTGWLHCRYTYDILLFVLGFPVCLSAATVVATIFGHELPTQLGLFFFAAVASLMIFRLAFSVIRWLLPYVEFSTPPQPVHRQIRIVVSVVILGIFSSLAAAAIWMVLVHTL